jgi:glycosyltransferase involved in cell wall biosynthesis
MSRVDVIIPCYRYAHFLRQCVESVLTQSHDDLRLLIIDDASPDHTPEVAHELVAHDRRVGYRRHESNRGHIATYNEGLDWAEGQYTLLLSADDLLSPAALERAVNLMDKNPNVGMTYGRIRFLRENQAAPGPGIINGRSESRVISGATFLEWSFETAKNLVAASTAVVRTELQRRLGGYRADLPYTGDWEMWMRFAAYSSVGFISEIQGLYRLHSCNMHNKYQDVRNLEQHRDAVRIFFDNHGNKLENEELMLKCAHCGLAEKAVSLAYSAFDRDEAEICGALLEFATAAGPSIALKKSISRLRLKLGIGYRAWSLIRPIWDRIRSREGALNSGTQEVRPCDSWPMVRNW